jgi:hypothetical protein
MALEHKRNDKLTQAEPRSMPSKLSVLAPFLCFTEQGNAKTELFSE